MIRTQVYLSKKQYEDIKLRANITGKPAAELIRELIDKGLEAKQDLRTSKNDLLKLAHLNITGGPKDLAQKLDDYLYDGKA
jgi:predicted DNA-binding protein